MWAAFAPLDGAALAPGQVTVKSYKKVVQHLEGRIVSEISVADGDIVEIGQTLLRLDNTEPLSLLEITKAQLIAKSAKEARLLAEQRDAPSISFPKGWSDSSSTHNDEMTAQLAIFESRKAGLEGSEEVLQQRIAQLKSRSIGLTALRESKDTLAKSYAEELEDINALLVQGFSDRDRLRGVERNLAQYQGQAAELIASISEVQLQIGETQLQILQLNQQLKNEVATELAQVQTELRDLRERLVTFEDRVNRTSIRSPASGVVNGMQVHTLGGVISSGSPIAEIVPVSEELILESRVSALDIDRVFPGQEAMIRFSSFGSRAPTTTGVVLNLSADAYLDQRTGQPYYLARIEVDAGSIDALGDLVLSPGMPAEVFIATGSRTLLQYMFKPFSNTVARSFIED
jgi:epimerase transport system membrane fusion protein